MATNSQIPFIPQGETYVIPAAAAAPAGALVDKFVVTDANGTPLDHL